MVGPPIDCRRVEKEDFVERYLRGDLAEIDMDAFEAHFFECERCSRELETQRALVAALLQEVAERSHDSRRTRRSPLWAMAAGLACVAVLAGLYGILRRAPSTPESRVVTENSSTGTAENGEGAGTTAAPRPEILELARVIPPAYEDTALRGADGDASRPFRAAMAFYVRADYTGAIPGLEEAARVDPTAAHVQFYLGAAQLLAGRTEPAIDRFRRVLSEGDSPFTEEARFYLAKALLQKGDVEAARVELRTLVDLREGLAPEAERLLKELDQLVGAAR